MIPLVDMHCHLLAGLDDGPATDEEAVAMCRMALEQGAGAMHALAHQNEHYPKVTPQLIREAGQRLSQQLREQRIPVAVFPGAEVMVHPMIDDAWEAGQLLSIADRKQYMLIEMPHGMCVDLRETVARLMQLGVRPILAHPEQCPELLFESGRLEELVHLGCLTQISTGNIVHQRTWQETQHLKSWFKRGLAHVIGSDGHSPTRRPPLLAEAYQVLVKWVGAQAADRACSINGMAILQGVPLRIPAPEPKRLLSWIPRFWA